MIGDWLSGRQQVEVPCTVDIENTLDSLHAYVELRGRRGRPRRRGHGARRADRDPPYGERIVVRAPGHGGAGRLARAAVDPAHRAASSSPSSTKSAFHPGDVHERDRPGQGAATRPPARRCRDTMLSPRFYTTDFEAHGPASTSAAVAGRVGRADRGVARATPTRAISSATTTGSSTCERLPEDLRKEFIDFLVSSVTAEFSGCVLYAEIKKRIKNPDIRDLFSFMSPRRSRAMPASSTTR